MIESWLDSARKQMLYFQMTAARVDKGTPPRKAATDCIDLLLYALKDGAFEASHPWDVQRISDKQLRSLFGQLEEVKADAGRCTERVAKGEEDHVFSKTLKAAVDKTERLRGEIIQRMTRIGL